MRLKSGTSEAALSEEVVVVVVQRVHEVVHLQVGTADWAFPVAVVVLITRRQNNQVIWFAGLSRQSSGFLSRRSFP